MAMDRSGNNRPGPMLTSGTVVPVHPPECQSGTGRAREVACDLSLLLIRSQPACASWLSCPACAARGALRGQGPALATARCSLAPAGARRTAEHAESCDSVQADYGIPSEATSAGPAQYPHMNRGNMLFRAWSCGDPWPTLGCFWLSCECARLGLRPLSSSHDQLSPSQAYRAADLLAASIPSHTCSSDRSGQSLGRAWREVATGSERRTNGGKDVRPWACGV